VLRLSKVRSGGGAYFLEVAAGTGTGIEPVGTWLVPGVPSWRLSGDVAAHQLDSVLAGRDPETSAVLGGRRDRVTVAGFDLTFSAPKSVSLLHALSEPEVSAAVADAHAEAVTAAVSYVERRALAVRRRPAGLEAAVPTAVEGVTAAGFVHRVSRALDPHLHTHVVVANVGRGPEGDWSALDGRGFYAHASAADGLYHVQLRHGLTRRLGVHWDPPQRGRADIAGVPLAARRAFSRRAALIAAHLEERGLSSGRARTVAGFATRDQRDPSIGADHLRAAWRSRAREIGLGPRRLEAVLDRSPGLVAPTDLVVDEPSFDREVTERLGDSHRSVTRRDVVRAWCRAVPAGAPAQRVEEAADRYLSGLRPEPGPRGERSGPGVAERRLEPPSRVRGRADGRRREVEHEEAEIARLLERRAMRLDRSPARLQDLGIGLG
jgi:conjugative relaxase-like TrwC/TraI family protein